MLKISQLVCQRHVLTTPDKENAILELFQDYDEDGSLTIDAEEIKKWLHEHGQCLNFIS